MNRITRRSVYSLLTTDLAVGADFISPTQWLMVHGRTDSYCTPEGPTQPSPVPGNQEAVRLDTTNHIDLYDVSIYVEPAVAAAKARFARWL